jgi:hypothetical protein
MKSIRNMTQPELCAFIQSFLSRKNIDVVLSGGASVAFYSSNKYVSYDLDLVNIWSVKRRAIHKAMIDMGFSEHGRYYRHPETQYLVEFLPGPLSIGTEPVGLVDEINLQTGILKIISPTDCVKDRLAAYYHWGDQQCLVQAIMVAKEQKIDINEIGRWSDAEGMHEKFKEIRARLINPDV